MVSFTHTRLWRLSLADPLADDPHKAERERLRVALARLRERASHIAADISRDLPDYTRHDDPHFEGLWQVADLATGPGFPALTPTEAFMLGAAFLVHDLGMAFAAYPGGREELRRQEIWGDAVVAILRAELGRYPASHELAGVSEEVSAQADAVALRSLHAAQAEELVTAHWPDPDSGEALYLIDDRELRSALGPTTGKLAHSHWWSLDRVAREFSHVLGAPGGFPRDWTIDALKLACILRVADAAHLSPTRAPVFMRALKRPDGLSADHWRFQGKLLQPTAQNGRLQFSSASGFEPSEASAWWLCFDALESVDRELRQVDALLGDMQKPPLAVRGVAGAESPQRLSEWVQVRGWAPIDVRPKVTDALRVAEQLGGRALYGENPTVVLRELVQNAADAVRARRIIEDRAADWGEVRVSVGSKQGQDWVQVEDNGIGMSGEVLAGPFLDFGVSYWGSSLMQQEFPGLLARGFTSTGHFGIGFFSVFMLADRVSVTTRRFDARPRDTQVLEFCDGIAARPLLRSARPEEQLRDGGTAVRFWPKAPLRSAGGLFAGFELLPDCLALICGMVCPCIDVNLTSREGPTETRVILADDWRDMPPLGLLSRLLGARWPLLDENDQAQWETIAADLRPIVDESGAMVGRACIAPREGKDWLSGGQRPVSTPGVVVVGGLTACTLRGVVGVLVGHAQTAARDVALPVASPDQVSGWASEQALLMPALSGDPEAQLDCAAIVRALGGDTASLPVARGQAGWLTFVDIAQTCASHDELLLVERQELARRSEAGEITLHANVIAVDRGRPGVLVTQPAVLRKSAEWPAPLPSVGRYWSHERRILRGLVVEAAAQAWGTDPAAVCEVSYFADNPTEHNQREIGHRDGQPVVMRVYVVRNPHVHREPFPGTGTNT